MAKGNPVKWVFDGTKLDRATVKRRVLEAMRDPGFRGRWIACYWTIRRPKRN